MRGKLTAAKCRALSEAGRYGDGNTLFLVVAPRGSKSWVQRLTVRGRRRDIGLGGYPLVSLAEAREHAEDNRRIARKGGDPLEVRRKAKTPTFRKAAKRTFEANRPRWRNDKHAASWMQTLERYAMPALGHLTVDAIDREAVLGVLTPIWGEKPETARRVRQRIGAIMKWAVAMEHRRTTRQEKHSDRRSAASRVWSGTGRHSGTTRWGGPSRSSGPRGRGPGRSSLSSSWC